MLYPNKKGNFALVLDLERHIEILLLNNDCVIIPNFGGFMVHHVEARYDERDCMFLPPFRTLGFNPQLKMNDSLLAQSYIEAYDISYPEAMTRIESQVEELNQKLDNEGEYELNDIGTLRRDENGNFDFTPCEAGIITPSLYGLSSFEMKRLTEQQTETSHAAVSLPTPVVSVETTKLVKPEKSFSLVETPNIAPFDTDDNDDNRSIHISVSLLRNIAAAIITFWVLVLIPSPLATEKEAYVQSKLNTSLLYRLMPKEVSTASPHLSVSKETPAKTSVHNAQTAEKQPSTTEPAISAAPSAFYSVVLASRITLKNANLYVEMLRKQGIKDASVSQKGKHIKVIYGKYDTEKEAYQAMNLLNKNAEFAGCWVTQIKL